MADEWTPPTEVSSSDFRAPRQGFGVLLARMSRLAARIAALEGSSPLRQAGVRGRPGMLSSLDFDGDGGHVNLGTTGWMLGAADGGPSFFILNGRLVIEELDAQAAALAAQDVVIAGQVSDLASRIAVTASAPTFNTGSLPNDATFHVYGPDIPITVSVPTGRIIVTVGCGQATATSGAGAVTAEATFSISGGISAYGDVYARNYAGAPTVTSGASLMVQRAFVLTPGTYTITGKMRAWASGTSTGSANFSNPYITVQVTG